MASYELYQADCRGALALMEVRRTDTDEQDPRRYHVVGISEDTGDVEFYTAVSDDDPNGDDFDDHSGIKHAPFSAAGVRQVSKARTLASARRRFTQLCREWPEHLIRPEQKEDE